MANISNGEPPEDYDYEDEGEDRDPAHIIISYYIMPFIFVIGFFGNVLSICVLKRKNFRNSTSVYLLMLAIVSLIYVVFYIPFIVKEYVTNGSDTYVLVMVSYQCYFGIFLLDSMGFAANWMTAAVAVERCIVVGLPLKSRIFCRRKYAWIICGVLLIISFLLNIPKSMGCRPTFEQNLDSPTNESLDVVLVDWPGYDKIKAHMADMILSSITPFIITFVSNVILITFMVRRWKGTKNLSADGKDCNAVSNANAQQRRAITIVVLANIILYLVSQSCSVVVYMYVFAKGMEFYNEIIHGSLGFYSNSLGYTYFCFSSVTYLIISRLYRNTAKNVLMSVVHRSQTLTSSLVSTISRSRNRRSYQTRSTSNFESEGKRSKSMSSEVEATSKV